MIQVLFKRFSARRGKLILRFRRSLLKGFLAGNVMSLFELSRMDAQVAVRCLQKRLQVFKSE